MSSDNKHNRGGGRRGRGRRTRRKEPGPTLAVSAEVLASIQPVLDQGEYIVFDIETTGGNPEKNGITEIFAIRFKDGAIVDTYGTLVNPEIPIPPIVRRMTGINDKMVRGAPKIDAVMPDFIKFAGKGVLVSHNTIGDMKFVRYFAKTACDVDFDNFFLCTHLLVERLAHETPDKSLKGLAEYFDLPRGELHRAEADAYVTLELFKVLLGKLKERNVRRIEEAVRLQGDMESGLRLGWGVTDGKLTGAPDGPGVYRLFDHERRLLFVSSASHLSRELARLRSLDQLPRPLLRLVLKAYDVDWVSAPSVFAASLLECNELDGHKVGFAPVDWHQRTMQALFLTDDEDGVRLGVGPMEEGTRYAYGPVRDRRVVSEFAAAAAQALGGKAGRQGMVIPKSEEETFLAYLDGKLPERLAALHKRSRSIALWFKPSERRTVKAEAAKLKALLDVRIPAKMGPMLDRAGVVFVPGVEAGSWDFHTVAGSRPGAKRTAKGEPEQRLRDGGFGAELGQEAQRETAALQATPMSAGDVNRVNATLWWIYNGRFEGKFVPTQELGAP